MKLEEARSFKTVKNDSTQELFETVVNLNLQLGWEIISIVENINGVYFIHMGHYMTGKV